MPTNPYDAPAELGEPESPLPRRVLFFGRGHLVAGGLSFALLLYAKATRKSGFSWTMGGYSNRSSEEVSTFLAGNEGWVQIEQFYRAFEGCLVLIGALFLISAIALLFRARWSVAVSNTAAALGLAGAAAFLGVAVTLISPALDQLCAALGTESREVVLGGFAVGTVAMMVYSILTLIFMNRPVVKNYLRSL